MQILCADGTRVAIRDIQPGQAILSFNETTGRIEPDVITHHWHSGLKPCLTLTTRTGKSVTLTREHQVLTFDGWKCAGELTTADRIAAPRRTPVVATEERADEEVRLLAYMIAEGSCSSGNIKFTNADPVIVADFIACATALGFGVTTGKRYSHSLSGARSWMRAMNIEGCTALTKRIPAWIYRLPQHQKWQFLAAIVDTDGWIEVARGRLKIGLANQFLINDLVYLFLQVGISCSVTYKPNAFAGSWELRIDQDSVAYCALHLPLRLKGEKLTAAAVTPRYSLLDTYPTEVTHNLPYGTGYALRLHSSTRVDTNYDLTRAKMRRLIDAYPHPRWIWLEQADVLWDSVQTIEAIGERDTYDVEVGGNHNLIGNGLVAHNSTGAELTCVALGARGVRHYALYVCATQDQADDHVSNIAALLETPQLAQAYPLMAERLVGKFGNSKGWRRNRLRTAAGFTVDALGLDTAARGVKLENQRPDLLIIDDIDSESDTTETTAKRISTLTRKLLPAGLAHTAVLAVQNLVHPDSVFAQLADGRVDMLADRLLSGPHPALRDAVYDEARGALLSGTPTWAGQDLAACQHFVTTWGLDAFRAECQHEPVALTGRFLPSMGLWDACQIAIPPLDAHTSVIMALDAGESSDVFALHLVGAHPVVPGGVAVRYSRAYVPDGKPLNFDQIERDALDLIKRYAVVELAYDPFLLGQFMRRLEASRQALPPLVPFHQGAARLEADKALLDMIEQRRIGHNGDPDLRAHIDNANRKMDADGRRLRIVKRRHTLKIDLAVALSMGAARWTQRAPTPGQAAVGPPRPQTQSFRVR